MKVLVTGLFEPATLHAIRRFGQLGYEVHTAEGHCLAFAGFSKYVAKRHRIRNMRYFPQQYAEGLLRLIESGAYEYYFPAYEEILLMSHYRERIVAAVKTTLPDTETLMRLHDKGHFEQLAEDVGIDTPKTLLPKSSDEARRMMADVRLPVAIKQRKTSGAAGFRIVHDRSHLEKQYFDVVAVNRLDENNLPMLQEFIAGPTTCTLHLCNQGSVIGEVMYRGIRTMPRSGGTTVLRESIQDDASSAAAAKIIEHLHYTGLCGFDFIIDEQTGRPFLVDGNCRVTPALSMAYFGGCDLIEGWIEIADGKTPAPLPKTKTGVRTKLQFADFVWLLESYLGSFKDWKGEHRLRKQWWRDKDFHYDIASWSDPLPNIMIWVYILTNCYKLIFTNFDSAQLFIFHNQFVEHPFLEDLASSKPAVAKQTPGS